MIDHDFVDAESSSFTKYSGNLCTLPSSIDACQRAFGFGHQIVPAQHAVLMIDPRAAAAHGANLYP